MRAAFFRVPTASNIADGPSQAPWLKRARGGRFFLGNCRSPDTPPLSCCLNGHSGDAARQFPSQGSTALLHQKPLGDNVGLLYSAQSIGVFTGEDVRPPWTISSGTCRCKSSAAD